MCSLPDFSKQLSREAWDYLGRRGYTEGLILEENLLEVLAGRFETEGIEGFVEHSSIVFTMRSLSGSVSGLHTAAYLVKDYRVFYHPEKLYLPAFYGTARDMDILWKTREFTLVEGIFDRMAIKRGFPELAVLARLTKGVSAPLLRMAKRTCTRMWLAFDMDLPGEKSSERAEKRSRGIDVVRLRIPTKDPGELFEKRGAAGVRNALEKQYRRLGS